LNSYPPDLTSVQSADEFGGNLISQLLPLAKSARLS